MRFVYSKNKEKNSCNFPQISAKQVKRRILKFGRLFHTQIARLGFFALLRPLKNYFKLPSEMYSSSPVDLTTRRE